MRDGYDTNNISGILRDFSKETSEITTKNNITSGDLGTSVDIITKVAAISAGREDLVTDSDTQVRTRNFISCPELILIYVYTIIKQFTMRSLPRVFYKLMYRLLKNNKSLYLYIEIKCYILI